MPPRSLPLNSSGARAASTPRPAPAIPITIIRSGIRRSMRSSSRRYDLPLMSCLDIVRSTDLSDKADKAVYQTGLEHPRQEIEISSHHFDQQLINEALLTLYSEMSNERHQFREEKRATRRVC